MSIQPQQEAGVHVTFHADDGVTLHGTYFASHAAQDRQKAVLIGPATGIKQRFYAAFATWMAAQGFDVLAFDNRGIGASRGPGKLRDSKARKQDWGQLDMPAAWTWLTEKVGHQDVVLVGHSAGGQLVGLMPQAKTLSAIVQIAGSSGHVKGLMPSFRPFGWFSLRLLMPLTAKWLGYVPLKRFGWGEDLPAGVGLQWSRWCLNPGYVANAFGDTIETHYFDQIRCPILNLSASDDTIATPKNVADILTLFPNAKIEQRRPIPADYGHKAIGHMGFFRRGQVKLWEEVVAWLDEQ